VPSGPTATGFDIEEYRAPTPVARTINTFTTPGRVRDTRDGMANDSDTASHGIENGVAHRTDGKKIRSTVNHIHHQGDVYGCPRVFAMGGGLFWLIHDAKSGLAEKISGVGDRLTKLETSESRLKTVSFEALRRFA
jgi:hypothetical protein